MHSFTLHETYLQRDLETDMLFFSLIIYLKKEYDCFFSFLLLISDFTFMFHITFRCLVFQLWILRFSLTCRNCRILTVLSKYNAKLLYQMFKKAVIIAYS